ncbi:MAG TPA: LLM class flavin-dependent oxidoreductase [Mycobacteriales bacterium]|nr:LLM class flavin-dependent oxidoreductase [Mycobacteriales bacterium]
MTSGVSHAVGLPTMGEFGDPATLVDLARAADEAGWDGVFFWDHLLWRDPSWPVANSTVVVGAAAAVTTRVRLGIMVNAVARRRPAQLAAETATLDALSGGRAVFGAALGSYPDEWTRLGEDGDPRTRADLMDESLTVIDALWSGAPVTHRGAALTVDQVRMALTPVQRPRVPVWIGGSWPARRPFRRAARWDGVMPTHREYPSGTTMPPATLAEVLAYVGEHRDPAAGPLDVVLEGRTEPGDTSTVAAYAEVGLTWWIEAFGWWRGGLATARQRIAAGPPG